MNLLTFLPVLAAEEGHAIDPARSEHWLWPADAELIFGTISSLLVFGVLIKFAGPLAAKALRDRTAKIQGDIDGSAAALAEAEADAAEVRKATGDLDAERARLFADADVQAEVLLAEGRARLEAELAELDQRADADIASIAGRVNDGVRADIARLSNAATERALAGGVVDAQTQQDLIENFIQKVGATQ